MNALNGKEEIYSWLKHLSGFKTCECFVNESKLHRNVEILLSIPMCKCNKLLSNCDSSLESAVRAKIVTGHFKLRKMIINFYFWVCENSSSRWQNNVNNSDL